MSQFVSIISFRPKVESSSSQKCVRFYGKSSTDAKCIQTWAKHKQHSICQHAASKTTTRPISVCDQNDEIEYKISIVDFYPSRLFADMLRDQRMDMLINQLVWAHFLRKCRNESTVWQSAKVRQLWCSKKSISQSAVNRQLIYLWNFHFRFQWH